MSDCPFLKHRGDIRLILGFVLMTAAAVAFLGQVQNKMESAADVGVESVVPATVPIQDRDDVRDQDRYPL